VVRVLLVDDQAVNREVVGQMVKAAGHEVTLAEGGAEAVMQAAHGTFDLILMDVRMPGMDGMEATRKIRTLPGLKGLVPIVATSAQPFVEKEIRAAGADGFITKVFSLEELIAVIRDGIAMARERDRDNPTPRLRGSDAMSDDEPVPLDKAPRVFVDRRVAAGTVALPPAPTPSPPKPNMAMQFWEGIGKLPGTVMVIGVIWGGFIWGFGPIKSQTQIDADFQKARVSDLAADLAAKTSALAAELAKQTSALAADQTNRANALSRDIASLQASPGGQLRQADITAWTNSVTELRGLYETQKDLLKQAQYDIKDLNGKYQGLTTTPARK
jgi:CheY-like chemotaxis protein